MADAFASTLLGGDEPSSAQSFVMRQLQWDNHFAERVAIQARTVSLALPLHRRFHGIPQKRHIFIIFEFVAPKVSSSINVYTPLKGCRRVMNCGTVKRRARAKVYGSSTVPVINEYNGWRWCFNRSTCGREIAAIVWKDELTRTPDFMNQGIRRSNDSTQPAMAIRVYAIWSAGNYSESATIGSSPPALCNDNFLTIFAPRVFGLTADQIIGIGHQDSGAVQAQFPVCKAYLFQDHTWQHAWGIPDNRRKSFMMRSIWRPCGTVHFLLSHDNQRSSRNFHICQWFFRLDSLIGCCSRILRLKTFEKEWKISRSILMVLQKLQVTKLFLCFPWTQSQSISNFSSHLSKYPAIRKPRDWSRFSTSAPR